MTSSRTPRMHLVGGAQPPLSVLYDLWVFGDADRVQTSIHAAQSILGLPKEVQQGDLPKSVREHFPMSWRMPLFGQREKLSAVEALKPPSWMMQADPADSKVMWWWMARHRNEPNPGAATLPLVYFRAFIPHLENRVNPFVWTSGARLNDDLHARPWADTWDTSKEREAVLEVMMVEATWFKQALMWARLHRLNSVLENVAEGEKPARL